MIKINSTFIASAAAAALLFVSGAAAQQTAPKPLPKAPGTPPGHPVPHVPLAPIYGASSERALKVEPNVNLSICVTQGVVKVNGWKRDELRVFVDQGSSFGFKVLQKSPSGGPVWVMVVGARPKAEGAPASECLWGGEIEIDAPYGSVINLKGRETTTEIDSVRKVNINTIGGDISLRNIKEGITASAGQGDITVERSMGAMSLEGTTGNILVFEGGPSEIGDVFKAKTNSGAVSLQQLSYRQVEVNSISGSVSYAGEILGGGTYSLGTTKGSIRLTIPADTSGTIQATYGYGSFATEVPLKVLTENIEEGPIKKVVGTLGKGGEATIRLNSTNGSIGIKKQ